MTYTVVNKDELPHSGSAYRFEGHRHGGAHVSFFISDTAPGKGLGPHTHPYDEVFILQEGELTFTVGERHRRGEKRTGNRGPCQRAAQVLQLGHGPGSSRRHPHRWPHEHGVAR
jgi:hypothetical protein